MLCCVNKSKAVVTHHAVMQSFGIWCSSAHQVSDHDLIRLADCACCCDILFLSSSVTDQEVTVVCCADAYLNPVLDLC